MVVRLKANECYQELLRYLSSYINLLNQQASLVGSRPLAGSKTLAPDSELSPVLDLVPMLAVIVIVLVFVQTFAIILGFAEQSFSIVWLIFRLDVRLRSASPSRRSRLFIHSAFVVRSFLALINKCSRSVVRSFLVYCLACRSIVLSLSFGLSLDRSRSIGSFA